MLKKFAGPVLCAILLVTPLAASAQTLAELQAQIQALLQQIAVLQGSTQTTYAGPTPYLDPAPTDDYPTRPQTTACPSLSITMQRGSRDATTGGQVTELQLFLADQYDLSEEQIATGFFGKITQGYVMQFQKAHGLPSFGIVGSLTRAKIAEVCGALPTQSASFSASPTYGPAPLTVTFSAPLTDAQYTLDFGNKTATDFRTEEGGNCTYGGCNLLKSHTYTSPGTYTATLTQHRPVVCEKDVPPAGVDCNTYTRGTATITVTGGASNNELALSFVSGNATSYSPGQSVHLVMKGVELFDGSAGTPDEGLNVQVYVNDSSGYGNYVAMNATYNQKAGYWEADFAAPTDAAKTYKLHASFYCSSDNLVCAQRYRHTQLSGSDSGNVQAEISHIFTVRSGSSSITVTAPNGGEQWEIGTMNTVTWTPYQYNPDINPSKDVTAYLERRCTAEDTDIQCEKDGFRTLGRVEESGKASIHWGTGQLNAASGPSNWASPASGYYIRVVNNLTGAWDRSDAPFTLTPRAITMKVNGSENMFALSDVNQPITVSWTTIPGIASCQLSGIKGVSFSTIQPSNGSVTGLIEYQVVPGGVSYGISLQCVRGEKGVPTQVSASAPFYVNYIPTNASLQVVSPNGGEVIDPSKDVLIKFKQAGIKSVSIALYKNDQWVAWITKDRTVYGSGDAHTINISRDMNSPEVFPLALGAAYKIYITGQKADGTGYVDDKSDAPFSFVATTSKPTATYRGYLDGSLFITTENISEADALANCKLNAVSNPTRSIRCTWGEKEIYRANSSSDISTPMRIFFTSGTSWIVPSDWNSSNNSIEVIGGGGGGAGGYNNNEGTMNAGGAGGGGAYSKTTNVTFTPSGPVSYSVGSAGGAGSGSPGGSGSVGGDTYFCNSTSNCASISGSAIVVGAKGGSGGTSLGGTGGSGGSSGSGIGSIKYSGGTGGNGLNQGGHSAGGGGGGAGGTTANGSNGGSAVDNCVSPGNVGGSGGATGGGAGGPASTVWAGGNAGSGGTNFDATHGAGGGGGGGYCNPNPHAGAGGAGGLYGGGGGGGGNASIGSNPAGGAGSQGIIVVSYTPVSNVANASASVNSNLANALTALESALKVLLGKIGR